MIITWRKIVSSLIKEDGYLFIIFALMAIAVFAKSYFSSSGYVSPDSSNYLALAQNLLERNSFFVSSYGFTGKDREFFAIWPAGYPFLIYLTAKATSLSVFWASKVLNILLIGLTLSIFRALFKQNAYLYGLIFLFKSYIEIYSYTWSETVFIFNLIWFSSSVYLFLGDPKKLPLLYLSILISSLFLFLSRYIGAFSFGLIGLLGLYYGFVKKDKSNSTILLSIAVCNMAIMFGYLYHNYLETGFPTGVPKIPSWETHGQLFWSLCRAVLAETNILYNDNHLILIQYSVLICIVFINRKSFLTSSENTQNNETSMLPIVFASIGLTYLFFVVLMRWMIHFDSYGFRLLAPGSFLLFIAFIAFVEKRTTHVFFNAFKFFLLSFAVLSWFKNVPYTIWKQNEQSVYNETVRTINKKYATVEKNSIIVFGERHLKYLRSDLEIRKPFALPYEANKENWHNFVSRIDPEHKKVVYLTIPDRKLDKTRFDQTIVDIVKTYQHNSIIKLP